MVLFFFFLFFNKSFTISTMLHIIKAIGLVVFHYIIILMFSLKFQQIYNNIHTLVPLLSTLNLNISFENKNFLISFPQVHLFYIIRRRLLLTIKDCLKACKDF